MKKNEVELSTQRLLIMRMDACAPTNITHELYTGTKMNEIENAFAIGE